ncbi:ALQxL family class IV lanthipeptide [Streptomyces sp. NBC_00669]|nr:ALQxL family class IV lanthipeptide [Streptomyces sp. NBC_00669]
MELDLDALQALPEDQDTDAMQCAVTCTFDSCTYTCKVTG